MSSSAQELVSNFLHSALGFSDDATEEYLLQIASKAKSAADIRTALVSSHIANSAETERFCKLLFSSTERKQTDAEKRKAKVDAEFNAKVKQVSKSYALVSFGDDLDSSSKPKAKRRTAVKKLSSKKSSKKRKRRELSHDASAGDAVVDDESTDSRKRKHKRRREEKRQRKSRKKKGGDLGISDLIKERRKKRSSKKPDANSDNDDGAMDGLSAEERQRREDQLQRTELEARLRLKELEKRRVKLRADESEALDEEKKRGAMKHALMQSSDRKLLRQLLDAARDESRRQYLPKRLEQRIELIGRKLREEKRQFSECELSAEELEERRLAEELLRCARELRRMKKRKRKGYHLPDEYDRHGDSGALDKDARERVVQRRYQDSDDAHSEDDEMDGNDAAAMGQRMDKKKHSGSHWETQQMLSAMGSAVPLKTADAQWREKALREGYAPVVESQVEFVLDAIERGEQPSVEVKQQLDAERLLESAQKLSLSEQRKALPIFKEKKGLMAAFSKYQIVIVVAETGSGKTTQLPQYVCEQLGAEHCVAVTQPRRVACMSVARRVADETDSRLGAFVGYSIRFEEKTSDATRIKFLTDGMLLREFLSEPDLRKYSALIIDEAHERTLHTDIVFGLVKDLCRFRKDMKVLISSATLQAEKFSEFFDDAPIYAVKGRTFAVDTYYLKQPESDFVQACVSWVLQLHLSQPLPGDILVFLTGQMEIEMCKQMIEERLRGGGHKSKELIVLPIYASMASEMQARIFEPCPRGSRKCIVATNIAETSLTIDGVVYVVDCGLCKLSAFDPEIGMDLLQVARISQASAEQRKGRAGRNAPGKCFRMYTKDCFERELPEATVPEIQRTKLAAVVLMLAALGITDFVHFDYMSPPPPQQLVKAIEELYALSALNSEGQLTKLGRQLAEFPMDPSLAKCIVASADYKCTDALLSIVSLLTCNYTVFHSDWRSKKQESSGQPSDERSSASGEQRDSGGNNKTAETIHKTFHCLPHGDMFTLLNVWKEWVKAGFSREWCGNHFVEWRALNRARDIREQLCGLCKRVEIEAEKDPSQCADLATDYTAIGKSLCSGLFTNVARLDKKGAYKCIAKKGHYVLLHPSSCLFDYTPPLKWLLFHELVYTTQEFIRSVVAIQPQWLLEIAPHVFATHSALKDVSHKKMPKMIAASKPYDL